MPENDLKTPPTEPSETTLSHSSEDQATNALEREERPAGAVAMRKARLILNEQSKLDRSPPDEPRGKKSEEEAIDDESSLKESYRDLDLREPSITPDELSAQEDVLESEPLSKDDNDNSAGDVDDVDDVETDVIEASLEEDRSEEDEAEGADLEEEAGEEAALSDHVPDDGGENIYEMISRIRHESTQIAPGVRSVRISVPEPISDVDTSEALPAIQIDVPEDKFVETVRQRAAEAVALEAKQASTLMEEPELDTPLEEFEETVGFEETTESAETEETSSGVTEEALTEETTPIEDAIQVPLAPPRPVLRYKTFAEASDFSRRTLPLPREMQTDGQQVNYQWLMAQLKVADSPERLHELAYRLNYKDLAVLFPTLATLSKRGPTEQIQTLIRTRASSYLYYHGWITLQFAYPRNAVAKALSDLCIQLEDRLYAFGTMIPARLGRRDNRPDLGPNRMIWGDIPLISEIALPNSRHFLTDVAKAARESSLSLERFFNLYAIYDDLPLGQAILARIAELQAGQTLDSPSLSKTFFERYRR